MTDSMPLWLGMFVQSGRTSRLTGMECFNLSLAVSSLFMQSIVSSTLDGKAFFAYRCR